MQKILLKPYPTRNTSTKQVLLTAATIAGFVFLINLIFNSHSIRISEVAIVSFAIGFSAIFLMVLAQVLFKRLYETDQWLVFHQIAFLTVTIFVLLLINQSINQFTFADEAGLSIGFIIPASFNALLCAFALTFMDYFNELKKNHKKALLLNEKLYHKEIITKINEQTLILKSREVNQQLKLIVSDIILVKAENNYIEIHTNLDKTLFRMSLKEFEEAVVDYDFLFRTHRSYLVNLQKVASSTGNANSLTLNMKEKNLTIPVARGRIKELFNTSYFKLLKNASA